MANEQWHFSPDDIVAILAATPERMAEVSGPFTDDQLAREPSPGEWSPREVLAHLRACADVWGDCIERILTEDVPTLQEVDPHTFIDSTDYREQPFGASLAAFEAQRVALLDRLRDLPTESWKRTAAIAGADVPLHRTVHKYALWLATHERGHMHWYPRLVSEATAGGA